MPLCSPGYQVEKRRPNGDWEKVNDMPILGESVNIPNLDEGATYEFRVAAVTSVGVGNISLGTAPITIKDKMGMWQACMQMFLLPHQCSAVVKGRNRMKCRCFQFVWACLVGFPFAHLHFQCPFCFRNYFKCYFAITRCLWMIYCTCWFLVI